MGFRGGTRKDQRWYHSFLDLHRISHAHSNPMSSHSTFNRYLARFLSTFFTFTEIAHKFEVHSICSSSLFLPLTITKTIGTCRKDEWLIKLSNLIDRFRKERRTPSDVWSNEESHHQRMWSKHAKTSEATKRMTNTEVCIYFWSTQELILWSREI